MISHKIIKFNKVGVSREKLLIIRAFGLCHDIFCDFVCFLAIDGKKGTITEGKPGEGTTAQVTITVSDDDFIDLALGKANAPAVRNSLRKDSLIFIFFYGFLF